jgi:hypothetical protein
MIHFEATVTLGTLLHAVVMVGIIGFCYRSAIMTLIRIESKQDDIIRDLKDK